MEAKRLTCRVVGHRWHHHELPDRAVKSTCQRCGKVEFGDGGPDWRGPHIVGSSGPGGPG